MNTRIHIILSVLALVAAGLLDRGTILGQWNAATSSGGCDIMTADAARLYVDVLSDDRMMGRSTPSPELDSAAQYIAAQLHSFGVEPVDGTYFHHYRIRRRDLGQPTSLDVSGDAYSLRADFIPYEFTGAGTAQAECVFVGFGISRPDVGYDDYEDVDVRGKIVLVVSGGPSGVSSEGAILEDLDPGAREKMRWAEEHGAIGFLLAPNPIRSMMIRPAGYPWPSIYGRKQHGSLPTDVDLPTSFRGIPSVSVGRDVVEALLNEPILAITERVRRMSAEGRPDARRLGVEVRLQVTLDDIIDTVRNVVGIVRGREHADEVVIVGAHYDHVGHLHSVRQRGSVDADTIFNGADDNASGCAALLLNARAFASLPTSSRPRRSVLFLFFSGEEKGHYGSRAWVADPPVPLSNTVAMINMDMVGRNGRDSIQVGGLRRSADMADILLEANRREEMTIVPEPESMFYRSDHASFAARRVPVLKFTSGLHADYHRVSDEACKVDAEKVLRVARLCYRTAQIAADVIDRPRYDGSGGEETPLLTVDDHDH